MPASTTPNATTTVAPVGRSQVHAAASPPTLTSAPSAHPRASRPRTDRVSIAAADLGPARSEEHTSELQSHHDLVCRLPLDKRNLLGTWIRPTSPPPPEICEDRQTRKPSMPIFLNTRSSQM